MKPFHLILPALALIFLAPPLPPQELQPPASMRSAAAERLHLAGISNAGKINDRFYRGAQPEFFAFAKLQTLGVTTVVDLRRENPAAIDAERQQVESLGMRFMHLPVGGFSAPGNAQVIQFLSIFRDHPEETVFLHCHYGEDRTGVFVAVYRMSIQHWSAQQAIKELDSFGFHRHWQREMRNYVRDFPAMLDTAPDLAQFQKTLSTDPPGSISVPIGH